MSQRTPGGDFFIQQRANPPQSINNRAKDSQCSQNSSCEADAITGDSHHKDSTQQRLSDGNKLQKLCSLDLSLCQKQQCNQKTYEVPASSPPEPTKPAPKPTQLHLPSTSASLLEKRKSLTLSLTPLGTCPPLQQAAVNSPETPPRQKPPLASARRRRSSPRRGGHGAAAGPGWAPLPTAGAAGSS